MKKLYSIALFLISLSVLSQTPGVINYQGVARYANGNPIIGPIGVSITIHVGSANGTPTLTEQYTPTTNQFGIFEVRIGSNTAGGLSNIAWGANKYWLGVAIDPAGGTNYGAEISSQQFISVPYALYAEKSGNAAPTSITTSTNVTVTSLGTNSFNLVVPNYIAGTNVSITAIGANNYLITAGGSATSTPSGPWSNTVGNVFLNTTSDNVGIGTSSPVAKLEVSANLASTNNAIAAYAQGGNGILATTSSNLVGNAAVYAQNSGSGNGVYGSALSTSATVAGVRGQNFGAGPGVFGVNNNSSTNASASGVYGETNALSSVAAGVQGSNFGMGAGVYGWQSAANGGPGVWGVANSSLSAGVYGINSNPNNASPGVMGEITSGSSSSSAHGVKGITNSSSNLAAGVIGSNSSNGPGVKGVNTLTGASGNAHGVHGEANSSVVNAYGVYGLNNGGGTGVYGRATSSININAYGVYGQNIGTGAGIFGANTIAANNPNAHGVNGLTNSTHTAAAGVVAENQGTGAAIRAMSGTNSTLSLWVENGHMKATSVFTVSVVTFTASGGFTGLSYIKTACNDVKGIINISTSATGVSNGESFEFNVSFNKMYQIPPTVVISGYGNDNVTYYLKSISNSFFSVRVINRSGAGLTTTQLANMNVSYYVIE